MFDRLHPLLLRWLRVPHDPEPPFGAPGSIRVFRAGTNFYYVRLAAWITAQVGAAIGIAFSVWFISQLRDEFDAAQLVKAQREQQAALAAANAPAPTAGPASAPSATSAVEQFRKEMPKEMRTKKSRDRAKQAFAERMPPWVMTLIEVGELLGIAFFLAQLPFTFAAVRLDWELRWYLVTDRSLRIRAGLWSLQESTMSFANLQQVEVMQGPLQRLLGIADVRVQSAGGGGGGPHGQGHDMNDSLHTGVFHGVDNAQEIRDLILDRLRHFRQAGLGDPDDHHSAAPASSAADSAGAAPTRSNDALAAARELLDEARALRSAVQ